MNSLVPDPKLKQAIPPKEAHQHTEQYKEIWERIVLWLTVYPKLSPTQLHACLPYAANEWRPVMEDMIAQKVLRKSFVVAETPTGRHQTFPVIMLQQNTKPVNIMQVVENAPEPSTSTLVDSDSDSIRK